VGNTSQKARYYHYWKSLWGSKDNERHKSLKAGEDCLTRISNASWWNWDHGSRPFSWRWSKEYMENIRDGIPFWSRGTPPVYFKPQRNEKDTEKKSRMREKLCTVLDRRYFIYGMALSLTSFFAVLKGETGIRMVYNGSSSGLTGIFGLLGLPYLPPWCAFTTRPSPPCIIFLRSIYSF
jgi:hypothetical protein